MYPAFFLFFQPFLKGYTLGGAHKLAVKMCPEQTDLLTQTVCQPNCSCDGLKEFDREAQVRVLAGVACQKKKTQP